MHLPHIKMFCFTNCILYFSQKIQSILDRDEQFKNFALKSKKQSIVKKDYIDDTPTTSCTMMLHEHCGCYRINQSCNSSSLIRQNCSKSSDLTEMWRSCKVKKTFKGFTHKNSELNFLKCMAVRVQVSARLILNYCACCACCACCAWLAQSSNKLRFRS
jgi:hypothetical protein